MRGLKRIGLCLVATVIASALWAGVAAAEAPEFGRCLHAEKVGKTYTGKFKNSSCTEEAAVAEREKKKAA